MIKKVTVSYEADGTQRRVYVFGEDQHVSTQIFDDRRGLIVVSVEGVHIFRAHFAEVHSIEYEVTDGQTQTRRVTRSGPDYLPISRLSAPRPGRYRGAPHHDVEESE